MEDLGRRSEKRYNFTLPVKLSDGTGVTRDISTSGIFFETEKALSIGDTVDLATDFEEATIWYEGRVVRVEKIDDRFGVAVALISYHRRRVRNGEATNERSRAKSRP